MHSRIEERDRLEGVASDSWYAKGANAEMTKYSFKVFSRYMRGETTLELGPAEGIMTEFLHGLPQTLTVVEGAKAFAEDLKRRFPDLHVVNCLFEEFVTEERYDNIILGHVLEHVVDPVQILKHIRPLLSDDGRVFAAVPNARSLHRQAAVLMGLLRHEAELNQADLHHGHRRVYNPESFRGDFHEAGYQIDIFGGYWLKPVSDAQIEEAWNDIMLQAFMQLGERYPDISGEIYVVARPKV